MLHVNVTMLRMCITPHSLIDEACNLFPLRKSVNVLYGLCFLHTDSLGMHASITCKTNP